VAKHLYYRQDAAKRQTAGIKFTQRPKFSIFAPIHVKNGMTKGYVGPLGHTKFHANRFTGWERGTKNIKNFQIGKESPHRGELLDRFLKFLRTFIRPTVLH